MREMEVRAAIGARVSRLPGPPLLVPEMALCQAEARIDLAMIYPERLVGWEIKTGADRLSRLDNQQEVYSRVFDRIWLAADVKHLDQALAVVPDWWGIMRAESRGDVCRLVQVRPSRVNRGIDLRSLVCLLWREETLTELRALDLADGLERAPRRELWDQLAAAAPRRVSPTELRRRVRLRLMVRSGWRAGVPRT
ncbi:MAG: sce7726 family protein [Jatrophihabitantaceae bacterium]